MTQHYFITATDTNIGKTYCSGILMQHFNADYWKPIQCGELESGGDRATVQRQTGLANDRFHTESYAFSDALSPHLAAQNASTSISLQKIADDWQAIQEKTHRPVIIEGAGGVLVPISTIQDKNKHTQKHTQKLNMLDVMQVLDVPIIIIAGTQLGTFNHTLLTVQAIQHKKLSIKGIIINGKWCEDTYQTLLQYADVPIIGHIEKHTNQLNPL